MPTVVNPTSGAPRYLFVALYAAAALMLIDQGAELLTSAYPFKVGEADWRFGVFGLVVSRVTTAVFIDVLVLLATLGLRHRAMLRFWGILHFVVAACLIVGAALFLLDTLELKNTVRQDAVGTLALVSGRAVLMVVLAVVYCCWIAIAALKGTKRGSDISRVDDSEPLLVTG